MVLPLAGSAYFLFKAMKTYPRDVATAAAADTTRTTRGAPTEPQPFAAPGG
jgi:hypothetical protein